ncbi:hypothetical protein B0H63DRAFT_464384 [Podospora didyma]|uniref:Uncharacterized protein n=1 Tax=Podospora didyma TaxID=330526 RepID=A0AAE0NYM2_9PEZI|nr:hypothetical protein B0H63DRAFT_464384 [Podospora didyma]
MIWELVPQTARLIGLMWCRQCKKCRSQEEFELYIRKHPGWTAHYAVYPLLSRVFPLLHACHESRRVWIPRYHRVAARYAPFVALFPEEEGRTVSPTICMSDGGGDLIGQIRFDMPFVSYENDIFLGTPERESETRFVVREERRGNLPVMKSLPFDPLQGLDRSRIQRIALRANLRRSLRSTHLQALFDLNIDRLPALQSIFLVKNRPSSSPRYIHSFLDQPKQKVNYVAELRDVPAILLTARYPRPPTPTAPQGSHVSTHTAQWLFRSNVS